MIQIATEQSLVIADKIVLDADEDKTQIDVFSSLGIILPNGVSLNSFFNAPEASLSTIEVALIMTRSKVVAGALLTDPSSWVRHTTPGIRNVTEVKRFSLKRILCDVDPRKIENVENIQVNNGMLYKIPFTVQFEVPTVNPGYLAFFAFPIYVPPQPSMLAPGILSDPASVFGKLTVEVIINNSSVVTESTLLYVGSPTDNNPWAGAVHQDRSGAWRTGKNGSPTSLPLTATSVPNFTIKDLRGTSGIQKNFNFDDIQDKAIQQIKDIQQFNKGAQGTLSNILYSVNNSNQLNFYFSFDMLSAIKNNAMFAPLYKNSSDLLGTCSIQSIKILRRRLNRPRAHSRLTGGGVPNQFYNQEVDVIEPRLSQINIFKQHPGQISYLGSDLEMDETTYGLYEYGVEIQILDKSGDLLSVGVSLLKESLAHLKRFLRVSLLPGNFGASCCRRAGFEGRYTSVYNAKLRSLPPNEQPWVIALCRYVGLLQVIMGTQTISPDFVKSLSDMTNPIYSGPSGVSYLIKLLEDFASKMTRVLKISPPKNPGSPPDTPSNASSSTKKPIFTIKGFFKTPFDADDLLNYGFDFLSLADDQSLPTGPGQTGINLKHISFSYMNALINNQERKTQSTSMRGVFLTPNYFRLPDTSYQVYKENVETRHNTKLALSILLSAMAHKKSPINFGTTYLPPSTAAGANDLSLADNIITNNQINTMHVNNCISQILTLDDDEHDDLPLFVSDCSVPPMNISTAVRYRREYVDEGVVYGDEYGYGTDEQNAQNNAMKFKGTSGTGVQTATYLEANHSYVPSYLIETDYFNGFGNNGTQNAKSFNNNYLINENLTLNGYKASIAEAPQNSTSVLETEFITKALDEQLRPEDLPSTAMRYGFIYGIEYLVGYRQGPVGGLMKRPVWKQLTKNILRGMQRSNTSLLCRHKRRTTYWAFNGIDAPLYNELFILGAFPTRLPPNGTKGGGLLTGLNLGNCTDTQQVSTPPMNILQFANSYDPNLPMISTYSSLARSVGGSVASFTQLAGRTTYNEQHYHEYIIDSSGNGIAKEACHPAHPNVCHTHQIIAGIVQSGQSATIDPSVGSPPHTHALPTPTATTGDITTTGGDGTTTTGGTTTGGGGAPGGY